MFPFFYITRYAPGCPGFGSSLVLFSYCDWISMSVSINCCSRTSVTLESVFCRETIDKLQAAEKQCLHALTYFLLIFAWTIPAQKSAESSVACMIDRKSTRLNSSHIPL